MIVTSPFRIPGSSGFCGALRKAVLCAMLLIAVLLLNRPALAASGEYVYDEVGILSSSEASALNSMLSEIEQTYDFECIVYVTEYAGDDIRRTAAAFMQQYNIGAGPSRDSALCIIHAPYDRDYAVVLRGEGQQIFPYEIYESMLDLMQPYLVEGDNAGAYSAGIEAAERCLARYYAGKTVRTFDVKGGNLIEALLNSALIGVPGGFLFALLTGLIGKSKMKTIRQKKGATSYVVESGVKITREEDHFIRTEVHRTKKQSASSRGGGKSGSFSSGGENFSGGSRKY